MKTVYVTVLTQGFEVQALTLARSILETSADSKFYFFCLDEIAEKHLRPVLPERAQIVPFEAICTDELARLKSERPASPFCWTCKPVAIDYALKNISDVDWVVYVDGDMMAFGDPNERLVQAHDCSVVLTPHAFRYYPFIGTETLVGTFNAGYFALRNTNKGREILDWWMDKCFEHCPSVPDPDAYGDQKYLDAMSKKFADDISIGFPVTDLAPWNIGEDIVFKQGEDVYFQSQKALIFHFQGFKIANNYFVDLYAGNMRLSKSVKKHIFARYVSNMRRAYDDLHEKSGYKLERQYSVLYFLKSVLSMVLGRHNIVRW